MPKGVGGGAAVRESVMRPPAGQATPAVGPGGATAGTTAARLADFGSLLAHGDRFGETLVVAQTLYLVDRLFESWAEALAGCERRGQVLHAVDDVRALVADRSG